MTGDELKSLFNNGRGYIKRLSRISFLSYRTIQRYLNGERAITPDKEKYFMMLHREENNND